ncbi:MAG: phosphotransferase [Actinomycetota bacterium]|nr:phosphotransferase [Actinomycetota bacterium]
MVIFERVARLLLPNDGAGAVVEADADWRLDRRVAEAVDDVVVWGRPPLTSGAGFLAARRFAGARRRALVRLRRRPPGRFRTVDAVWWMPPVLGGSRFRQSFKNALSAGAAVTLSRRGRFERVLDAAWSDAGYEGRATDARPSSGGSLRVDVRGSDEPKIFRAGLLDSAVDPRSAGRALALLEQAGVARVPRLLAAGTSASAGWTVETRLEGARPAALTDDVIAQVVALTATFPTSDDSPGAFGRDLATIGEHLPAHAPRIDDLAAQARETVDGLPSILRHGDLWVGNLLVRDGSVVGLVDWDAAHASGVPGTDLMHLLSGYLASGSLGDRFAQKPWRREEFATATASYWKKLALEPTPPVLDAVALAWWIGQLAANLERLPHLAETESWIASNVDMVLDNA